MPRFAFTDPSIGSTTTLNAPSRSEPASSQLLRHEHEVLAERGKPLDDGVLGSLIDRGRVVSTLAPPQHGLALDTRRQLLEYGADIGNAEPAGLEPRSHRSSGWKTIPESGFGKKYVLFCGMRSPRRATRTRPRHAARAGGTRRRHRRDRPRPRPRRAAAYTRCPPARDGRQAQRRARPPPRARPPRDPGDTRSPRDDRATPSRVPGARRRASGSSHPRSGSRGRDGR